MYWLPCGQPGSQPGTWTNDVAPEVGFRAGDDPCVAPNPANLGVDGFAYTVDRVPGTVPVMPTVGSNMAYAPVNWFPNPAVGLNAPVAVQALEAMYGWLAKQADQSLQPGATKAIEGLWYVHARSAVAATGTLGVPSQHMFGLDITPPDELRIDGQPGIALSDGLVDRTFTRADVIWDNGEFLGLPYDRLSGDSRFVIYLNGTPIRETKLVRGTRYMSTSIESLKPGRNVIGVSAMDAAGNQGPTSEVVTYCDTGAPSISINSPNEMQTVLPRFQITVSAVDDVGVAKVDYEITDGGAFRKVWSATEPPFSVDVDLQDSVLATTTLTLKATATDTSGRTATATRRFVVDMNSVVIDPNRTEFAFVDQGPGLGTYHFRWVDPTLKIPSMWINDIDPNVAFKSALTVSGFAYTLDRSTNTTPSMPSPGSAMAYAPADWTYSGSPTPLGSATLDMRGWLTKQTDTYSIPGMQDPVEGVWYVHARSVDAKTSSFGTPAHFAFGLDVTAPRAVRGLQFADTAGNVISNHRRDLIWDNGLLSGGQYDDLSGDSRFVVYLNGAVVRTLELVRESRYQAVSLENLPAGRNVIGIAAMDAAGNAGPITQLTMYCDPDTPQIAITNPKPGQRVSRTLPISVNTTDQGGIAQVRYEVDGRPVGASTTPPFSLVIDLSGFSQGTHTLRAIATDMMGRTAEAAVDFYLDLTIPPVQCTLGTQFAFTDTQPGLSDYHFRWVGGGIPDMWINDLKPGIAFEATPTATAVDGFAYVVDRAPETVPTLPSPGSIMSYAPVNWDGPSTAPMALGALDMRGWLSKQSGSYSIPGMQDPVEGVWYVHARAVIAKTNTFGCTGAYAFGLDVTPPRAVSGLQFSDTAGQVIPFNRRDIVWDNGLAIGNPYDSLSGDSRFSIYVNGVKSRETRLLRDARYMGATLEDLPEGRNVIGVAAVDAAGNEGTITELVTYCDPDAPKITIVTPIQGQKVSRQMFVSVNASDAGGIAQVRYEVDGRSVGSTSDSPYFMTVDLSSFPAGAHRLRAIVTDMAGRTAEAAVDFVLDLTQPSVECTSSVSFAFTDQVPGLGDYHFRWVGDGVPAMWINDIPTGIAFSAATSATVDGFPYTVDRMAGTVPTLPVPGSTMAYAPTNWSGPITTPLSVGTLDLRGWLVQQKTPYWISGMSDPVEGIWFVHARSYTATSGAMGCPADFGFGLDITPPRAVTGLQFSDGRGAVVPFGRRDITWDNGVAKGTPYDDLSGDSRFGVYLDGKILATTRLARSSRYMFTSVESLLPGRHVVDVSCMDAAGNEGPKKSIVMYSDPDTPTISIVTPKSGQTVPRKVLMSVVASDAGGIQNVRYEVDGVLVGKSAKAPYSITADLRYFKQGRHTLTATVTDMMGRAVSAKTTFVLDTVAPRFSSVSVAPTDVYPIIQDGYKDYTTLRSMLSEGAKVRFEVRNSKNQVIYSAVSTRKRGWNSFRWKGQGVLSTTTVAKYSLRLVGSDTVGNSSASGRYTVIVRNYEVIQLSRNKAKIVAR